MIVRAITGVGDWTFGAGKTNYLSANAAIAQLIGTRLSSFLGDCFFATNDGIDWFNLLGNKNLLALELAINATILNTEGVTGIITLSTSLDNTTRIFSAVYSVTTSFGNVEGVVNQNLGVGPLAPPVNNLLPQFTQPLLNNVAATAVNNARFDHLVFWEVDIEYFIERRDDTQGYVQRGTLICKWDQHAGLWTINDDVWAGNSGPTTGVTFTIDATTGQVYYASDDLSGSNYVGNLIAQSLTTFVAGL
jgi:hypothetical protein